VALALRLHAVFQFIERRATQIQSSLSLTQRPLHLGPALEDLAEVHLEHRIFDHEGAVRWVEVTGKTLTDAGGEPKRMLGTVMDITARKLAAGELEQARQQVGQLQNELGTARVQLRQLGKPATSSAQAALMARQALERELEQGTLEHADAEGDGFADTELTLHDTQYGSLLLQ